MKKKLLLVVALFTTLILVLAFSSCGKTARGSKGLEYVLTDDGYAVDGIGTCTDTDLVIPSTYKDLPVTSIGSSAFMNCDSLISVVIPNSVTEIGSDAFYDCDSLTNITVDENNKAYKSIDGNLYTKDGKTLVLYAIGKDETSFEIPYGVTSIGDCAFHDCDSLTSIVIPDSVTEIGSWAFWDCDSLKSIVIPDSVTSIGSYAFYDCDSLKRIVIPDSVTSIGYDAFYRCYSLAIYCEAESKPSGYYDWNHSNLPVVWGYKG